MKSEIGRLDETLQRYDERAKQFEDALAAQPDSATALQARVDAIAEQLSALEGRLTTVSTELANQLTELGNDIEALNNRPPGTPLDEGTLDELRDTQTRLASEQARYQIAFREDLARLAEQLRRPDDPPPPKLRFSRSVSVDTGASPTGGSVDGRRFGAEQAERLVDEGRGLVDAVLVGTEVTVEAQLFLGCAQQFVRLGEQIGGCPGPRSGRRWCRRPARPAGPRARRRPLTPAPSRRARPPG